jgi:hypothetical protein
MRKRDHKALLTYVRQVADALELRDWDFVIRDEPPPDGVGARTYIPFGRKRAELLFPLDIRTLPREDVRHRVVHELIHSHLEPAASQIRCDLEDALGKTADIVFWAGYKRNAEYAIDALAVAFCKYVPLIDWP